MQLSAGAAEGFLGILTYPFSQGKGSGPSTLSASKRAGPNQHLAGTCYCWDKPIQAPRPQLPPSPLAWGKSMESAGSVSSPVVC